MRAPSRKSANRSFSWWSTFGPNAKLFTNTMVAELIFSRCSSAKKSPFINSYSLYFFPNHRIHMRNVESISTAYCDGTSARSIPMHVFSCNAPAICKTTCPTPEPKSMNTSSFEMSIWSIIWHTNSNDVSPYTSGENDSYLFNLSGSTTAVL